MSHHSLNQMSHHSLNQELKVHGAVYIERSPGKTVAGPKSAANVCVASKSLDHVPAEGQLRLKSPVTLNMWKYWPQLWWHHDIFQYQWDFGLWQNLSLWVSAQLKDKLWHHFDESATWGCLGVVKTIAWWQQSCYWCGMVLDKKVEIATCAECKQNQMVMMNPHAPLQCFQVDNPGDRLHLDILRLFLKSNRGDQFVLMMVDQFTWWLNLQALSIQDVETVAHVFFKSYNIWFGIPLSSIWSRTDILIGISPKDFLSYWSVRTQDNLISAKLEWARWEIQPANVE